MICKKCGENNDIGVSYFFVNKENNSSIQQKNIPDIYKNYPVIPQCKKCFYPLDYKNLSLHEFWKWLNLVSMNEDVYNIKGEALVRYFGIKEILNVM